MWKFAKVSKWHFLSLLASVYSLIQQIFIEHLLGVTKRCLDCKEIQPVHSEGDQSWMFIGRTDAEASILWPPDVKSQLFRKYLDAGKD